MRIIPILFLAALFALARTAAAAADAGPASIRAILVVASNQHAKSDSRLAAYEPNLRRILRFESYRFAGEGAARIAQPGKGAISLGSGHSVEIEMEKSDGKSLRARVNWTNGGRSLINMGHSLRPGVPAVLGGPSTGKEGEVWAVILVAE